jgi:hypothetical protein
MQPLLFKNEGDEFHRIIDNSIMECFNSIIS